MLRSSSWQPSTDTPSDQVACWHKAVRMTDTAKTIDHHVSAVLAKLGPPDRNAAAQAARLGL